MMEDGSPKCKIESKANYNKLMAGTRVAVSIGFRPYTLRPYVRSYVRLTYTHTYIHTYIHNT